MLLRKRECNVPVEESINKKLLYEQPKLVVSDEFDKQSESDPTAVSEYVCEIFIYYKQRERFFKVSDYMARHPQFSQSSRLRLVDWMVEVQEIFEMNHETLYLAVKLLDIFLDNTSNIASDSLQTLACASLLLASKFDERSPPLLDDFVQVSDEAFDRDQLIATEQILFRTVHFDLGSPISYRFLRRYSRLCRGDMTTLTLARYILETSLLFLEFCRVSESLIAVASYLLAIRMKRIGEWNSILEKHSGYKLEQVEPLVKALNHMIICIKDVHLGVIFNKYSHEIFYEVAAIKPLTDSMPHSHPIGPPKEYLRE
jgi:hypothetical protein